VEQWESLLKEMGPRLEAAREKKRKYAILLVDRNIGLLIKAAKAAGIKSSNMDDYLNDFNTKDFECPVSNVKPMINPVKHTLKIDGKECHWTMEKAVWDTLIQKHRPCPSCNRPFTRANLSTHVELQQRINAYYHKNVALSP
jgi:hypothetical protein